MTLKFNDSRVYCITLVHKWSKTPTEYKRESFCGKYFPYTGNPAQQFGQVLSCRFVVGDRTWSSRLDLVKARLLQI